MFNLKHNMRDKEGENNILLNSNISKVEFSAQFLNWASEFHKNKEDYLNFVIAIQRLLLRDIYENNYSKKDVEKLENNLLTLHNVILNA